MCIKVLPNRVKQRLVNELDKRLDLDIDTILQSPKLRLQLSPAELDKRLLELYKNVADGPSGDVLRVIGGGNDVAFQDRYIRRKKRSTRRKSILGPAVGQNEEKERTTSQWVKSVLKKNLRKDSANRNDTSEELKMCLSKRHNRSISRFSSCQTTFTKKFYPGRSQVSSFSLLI